MGSSRVKRHVMRGNTENVEEDHYVTLGRVLFSFFTDLNLLFKQNKTKEAIATPMLTCSKMLM